MLVPTWRVQRISEPGVQRDVHTVPLFKTARNINQHKAYEISGNHRRLEIVLKSELNRA